ncbi:protein PFF0380w-like isoform X1 [Aphidius gifuensis]|uniref:protein PFF0380w-like isoform X1 n=1 Tax=Aphidius gifuensis TaxID=684658 RepID=UPI001CDB62C4|nr:protein PFF0380w-like isoform X1 [Aphidius gifuensis]
MIKMKKKLQADNESKRSLKFIFPRQLSKNGKFRSQLSPKYLRILRETISLSNDTIDYHTPLKYPSIFTSKNEEKINLYSCNECMDSFQFETSLTDHMTRRSWVLGYYDNTYSSNDTSLIKSSSSDAKNTNRNTRKILNNTETLKKCVKIKRKKYVKLFYNKCQFLLYLNEHNITTIDTRYLMLMPLPNELESIEYHQFDETCIKLMGHLFAKGIHIVDWLEAQNIHSKWWCNSKLFNNNSCSINNISFFTDKPLLSLIKKVKNNTTNKLIIVWNNFINLCHEKNYNKNFSFDSDIKFSIIISKLSPKLNNNNNDILKLYNNNNNNNNNDIIFDNNKNKMSQDFINYWKFKNENDFNNKPTLNRNKYGEYELLSAKIQQDGTAYLLIKKNLNINIIDYEKNVFIKKYNNDYFQDMIDKYKLKLFNNLHNSNYNNILKLIINDVRNVSLNFSKTNFINDEIVLSVNLKAMKTFYMLLNDNFNNNNTSDVNNDNDDDNDDWEYNLDTCDNCDVCKKIKKPTNYIPGVSKPAVNETIYCQCYNFICHLCNSQQGNYNRYNRHMKLHQKVKPFECPDCLKKFQSTRQLEQHIWTKCYHILTQVIYSCKICNIEGFLTIEELTRHYSHAHIKTIYYCNSCFKIFTSYNDCLIHKHDLSINSGETEKLFICEFGQCIVRPDNYHLHLLNNHREIGIITYYTCPFCYFIIRNNNDDKSLIKKHIFTNHLNRLSEIITNGTLKNLLDNKNLIFNRKKNNFLNKLNQRIAFNCPNNFSIDFNCHLCGDMIDTNSSTIKNHFGDKHSGYYKLCNVHLSLIDETKKNNVYHDNFVDKLDDSLVDDKKAIEKRKIDIVDDDESSSSASSSSSTKNYLINKKKRLKYDDYDDDGKKIIEQKNYSNGLFINKEIINNTSDNFKCKKCNLIFSNIDLLKKHIASDHRIKINYSICLECGENFIVAPSLKIHLKAFHGISDPNVYLENNKNCIPNSNLNDINGDENNGYNCHVCMATFENNAAVEKHLRVHGMAFLNRKKIQAKKAMDSIIKTTETP